MKYIFFVVLSCVFFQGFSQNYFDIVNFTYTHAEPNDFELSDAKSTVKELALEVNFPIVLNKKTILLTGLFANKTKVHLDANMPSTNLDVLGLNFGVNKTLNQKWSSTFMAFTRLASDQLTFSSDQFQIGFLSLFTQKKNDRLKFRYGLYANTEKFGTLIVPILGLYYLSANKKFEANLNVPIIADINYKIYNKTWLGLRFDGIGATYMLHEQSYGTNGNYVVKNSNELSGYLRFQLSKSLYINSKVGVAIGRNYKVYEAKDKIDLAVSSIYLGDNRTQLNERFDDGAVFKIELVYRLHFN
jgi:hypothetical protein